MNGFLISIGKKRTLWVSYSMLILSIYIIGFYSYYVIKYLPTYDLIFLKVDAALETIKLILFSILLKYIYKGKIWAKQVLMATLIFDIVISLKQIATTLSLSSDFSKINKINLLSSIFIYCLAILHFNFSKSFNVFTEHQNSI